MSVVLYVHAMQNAVIELCHTRSDRLSRRAHVALSSEALKWVWGHDVDDASHHDMNSDEP